MNSNLNLSDYFYVNPESPTGLSWKVERRVGRGKGYIKIKPNDPAGVFDGSYYVVILHKVKYKVHRIIYQLCYGDLTDDFVIDHIDGDKLNNKISNLRKCNQAINSRNRKMPNNNTSGFVGVHFSVKRNITYAVSTWYDLANNKCTKSFSSRDLGLLECFSYAVKYRELKINELNQQNACYSTSHGKDKK